MQDNYPVVYSSEILGLIITITISLNLIGALTALIFTNHCEGLLSDSCL